MQTCAADAFDSWLACRPPETVLDDGILLPGTAVGSHKIVAHLGRGGFADVYRAQDGDGRDVAIKILWRLDEKTRLRFERESRILAQVRHSNFPVFLGCGSCGVRPYIVMELLGPFGLPYADRDVAAFLYAIMGAVEALHRHGFVHRDIKPANILARATGEPVLVDFGLAVPLSNVLRERAGLSIDGGRNVGVGTAGFSAPEQFTGQVAGRSADVHALGALIGACFGERIPRCWQRIFLTATNSNPDARYPNVAELRRAIRRRHTGRIILCLLLTAALAAIGFACSMLYGHYRERSVPQGFHRKSACQASADGAVLVARLMKPR